MNTGAIAKRYAKALLLQTQDSGRGEQVFGQVRSMLASPDAALPQALEPDIQKLVALLVRNGRQDYLKFILHSFLGLYCKAEGICRATLTTAVPSPELAVKMEKLLASKTGGRVLLEQKVEPDLIGGFILDVEEFMLDASVRNRIETIRRQFVEKNTRIV